MTIRCLPLGALQANCYLLSDEEGATAVIDPGDEAGTILETVRAGELAVEAILLTHAHFDHILAADELRRETGAPVYVYETDAPALPTRAGASRCWQRRGRAFAGRPSVERRRGAAGGAAGRLRPAHAGAYAGQLLFPVRRRLVLGGYPFRGVHRPHGFPGRGRSGHGRVPADAGGAGTGHPRVSRAWGEHDPLQRTDGEPLFVKGGPPRAVRF